MEKYTHHRWENKNSFNIFIYDTKIKISKKFPRLFFYFLTNSQKFVLIFFHPRPFRGSVEGTYRQNSWDQQKLCLWKKSGKWHYK